MRKSRKQVILENKRKKTMNIEQKVDKAIMRIAANSDDTKLDEEIYRIRTETKPHRMSSKNSQVFINKLCEILSPVNYLEIGIARGASFFAASHQNKGQFVGIDNWSKYKDNRSAAFKMYDKVQNSQKNEKEFKIKIIERDCWDKKLVEKDLSQEKFDVFFYDGNHSYESQRKILNHFAPLLADKLFLLVDDFCADIAPTVQQATWQAIEDSGYKLKFHRILYNSDIAVGIHRKWHSGMLVAYLEK